MTLLVRSRSLMDSHDNLRASLKPLVDAIALSMGVSDDNPALRWQYEQCKTKGDPGVTITLELKT